MPAKSCPIPSIVEAHRCMTDMETATAVVADDVSSKAAQVASTEQAAAAVRMQALQRGRHTRNTRHGARRQSSQAGDQARVAIQAGEEGRSAAAAVGCSRDAQEAAAAAAMAAFLTGDTPAGVLAAAEVAAQESDTNRRDDTCGEPGENRVSDDDMAALGTTSRRPPPEILLPKTLEDDFATVATKPIEHFDGVEALPPAQPTPAVHGLPPMSGNVFGLALPTSEPIDVTAHPPLTSLRSPSSGQHPTRL